MSLANQQGVIRFGWAGSEGHLHHKKILKAVDDDVMIAGSTAIFTPIQLAEETNIGTSNQVTNGAGWDPFDIGSYPHYANSYSDYSNYDVSANVGTHVDSASNLQHMNLYGPAQDTVTGVSNGVTQQITGPTPVIGVAMAQSGYLQQAGFNASKVTEMQGYPTPLNKSLPQYAMGFYNIQHKDDIGTIKIEASKLPKRAILYLFVQGGGGGAGGKYNFSQPGTGGFGGKGASNIINFPLEMFCEGSNQPVDFYLHYYIGAGGAGGPEVQQGGSGGGATFVWWNHNPEANLEDVEYTPNDISVDANGTVTYLNVDRSKTRRSTLLHIACGGGGGGATAAFGNVQAGHGAGSNYSQPQPETPPGNFGGSGTGNHSQTPGGDSSGPGSLWDNNSFSGYMLGTSGRNMWYYADADWESTFDGNRSAPGFNVFPETWPKRNEWVNKTRKNLQSGPSPHMWATKQSVLDDTFLSNYLDTQFYIFGAGGGGGYYQGSSGTSVMQFAGLGVDDVIGNGGGSGQSWTFHPRFGDFFKPGGPIYSNDPGLHTVRVKGRRIEEDWSQEVFTIFRWSNSNPTEYWVRNNGEHDFGGHGFTGVRSGQTSNVRWGAGGSNETANDGPTVSGSNVKNVAGRNGLPGCIGVWIRDPSADVWS